MARKNENTGFACANCGEDVLALTNGSYRNHCPFCLYSLHVDNKPGDRSSFCHAIMRPIGLTYKAKKGWQIIHKCKGCGHESVNKIAEMSIQPDCIEKLAQISVE